MPERFLTIRRNNLVVENVPINPGDTVEVSGQGELGVVVDITSENVLPDQPQTVVETEPHTHEAPPAPEVESTTPDGPGREDVTEADTPKQRGADAVVNDIVAPAEEEKAAEEVVPEDETVEAETKTSRKKSTARK